MARCRLTDLGSCLPEKFVEYIISIFNAPLDPLLRLIKALLTEPVNINVFYGFWAIIVYVISLFYGLFFLFAGFNFLISGYDAAKRENAKRWLRNIVLMVLFIQSSFFIYSTIIELGSLLAESVIGLISPRFFLVTADSISSIGLQLTFLSLYIIVLLITVVLLGLRYLFVSIGVVLFPFAMFFYFIPPLQSYGKMILNGLLTLVFVAFFDAIILFGASTLTRISLFAPYKMLLATVAFVAIDLMMVFVILFVLVKAAFSVFNSDVGKSVMRAAKYVV